MIAPVLPVYKRSALVIERGEGVWLYAPDGTRYLDFAAGIAVNALGHCHPHLVAALTTQAQTLWHCSNYYRMPGLEKLASRYVQMSFADTAFFCSSGAEAVEAGIKMIRKYFDEAGQPDRYRIITVEGSFHGRTLATISASGSPRVLKGFEPAVDGFDQVPFDNLAAIEAAITPYTAAILVEPVQGEGGIRVCSNAYLQGLRKIADTHGLLLFFDEVQCGMGRTGSFFAHTPSGISPDILSLAKGIGNGFPLGALLATEKAASGMVPGSHGSTYGGNPLSTAVGNAVLDVMLTQGFMEHVQAMGEKLMQVLQQLVADYPHLFELVRGRGLMIGLKPKVENILMVERLRQHGLLTVPAGDNIIRVVPPLIIEQEHINEAEKMLRLTCEEWV